MKLTKQDKQPTVFKDIPYGTYFFWTDCICIKSKDSEGRSIAIRLDGHHVYYPTVMLNELVTPIEINEIIYETK